MHALADVCLVTGAAVWAVAVTVAIVTGAYALWAWFTEELVKAGRRLDMRDLGKKRKWLP